MASALNAHGAEVHREHVERGFGAALNRCGGQCREAVDALGLHGFDQQSTGGATGEGFDHRGRQRIDEACIQPQPLHHMPNAFQAKVQRAGCAQYAHCAEHGDQIRQQALGDVEAFLRTFDEGLVDQHLA